MNFGIFSFTKKGTELAQKIITKLGKKDDTFEAYCPEKYAGENSLVYPLQLSLKEQTGCFFKDKDSILYIGACGIAVRSIAPFIEDKLKDPAVLVIDETGQFVISLLSGHFGLANELAERTAALLNAVPVITTATDRNHLFSVDTFGKKNNLYLPPKECHLAKEISACLLDGKKVPFYTEHAVSGSCPEELIAVFSETDESYRHNNTYGFCISVKVENKIFANTLHLIPNILTIGIGCKKDTDPELLINTVESLLQKHNISVHAIKAIASISLKRYEPALAALADKLNLPVSFYSAEELNTVPGQFHDSDFVKKITGTGNVCERAAILASKGKLYLSKQAENGITLAIAEEDIPLFWNYQES